MRFEDLKFKTAGKAVKNERKKGSRSAAKTYHDRLTVVRKRLGRDPQTQESVELEEVVYKDVLCALSQSGNNKPDRQEFYSERQMGAVLFTPQGILLEDNDIAVVVTEAGQTVQGVTGRTFAYISHGETPLQTEGLA